MHTSSASDTPNPLQRLAEALTAPDETLDPAHLGLLMAAQYNSRLDIQPFLEQLDGFAARVKERMGRARSAGRMIEAMNTVLFTEEGFSGNVEDYYDPRNSFLNEVLTRKTGIPISLSVIYLAVAHRLKLPFAGVGLPLHFIVKWVGAKDEIYLDPFQQGRVLTIEECAGVVEKAYGAPVQFQFSYLEAVPTRLILYRMINNLKYIFLRHEDFFHAGLAIDQMMIVQPDQPDEVRDRGLLYFQERKWSTAIEFLTRYLREHEQAKDVEEVRARLLEAYERRASRN